MKNSSDTIGNRTRDLNLLEPSGPVQACNGIALPFYIYVLWF